VAKPLPFDDLDAVFTKIVRIGDAWHLWHRVEINDLRSIAIVVTMCNTKSSNLGNR
jgi:hypothetical protein